MTDALAIIASHAESWFWRITYALTPLPARHNGHERRKNPRRCVLCGGPMRPDRRPPRDTRGHDGKIRRLPEETLHWFKCGRCGQSQVGLP